MSVKRQATTELNHDNWDQEDPAEHEEMGSFKPASKDILEKRVIRTAKRRSQVSADEPKKSVFSGFGGFNKSQPSSFNFLANLTNGNKNSNGSSTTSDTVVTSSLFSSKPTSGGTSSGLFGVTTSSTPTKSSFGSSPFQSSSVMGSSPVKSSTIVPSTFTATKADSTSFTDSPFKVQPVSSSGDVDVAKSIAAQTPQITSTLFSVTSTNANENKSLFSSTNSTPFKIQPISSTPTAAPKTLNVSASSSNNTSESEKKSDDNNSDKKMKYYAKLKGLNESVSDWIKKHVEQTPLCILSPIFKDYEKYLKDIQEEYQGTDKDEKDKAGASKETVAEKTDENKPKLKTSTPFGNSTGSSLFNTNTNNTTSKSVFGNLNSTSVDKHVLGFGVTASTTPASSSSSGFSFGTNSTTSSATSAPGTTTTNTGFSFGVTSTIATTSSPFALATNSSPTNQPFSFGIGKPFSFSSNVNQQQNTEANKTEKEDEDEPPKVEFTPVVEENSVFDKRCKIFVKKDNNFVDKGVGTLYIKKIEDSGKHQLLVRANTNLGTVLLNLMLSSGVPTQRMGKNNVMLICIPTPDAKPPPTPVLIRVKSSEEADELLETLNKYKT